MRKEKAREEKNCFGLVRFSRITSGQAMPLFGSSIKHTHYIDLVVSRATKYRSFGRDGFLEGDQLLRLSISQSQFAEMITSMNTQGVPCTLNRVAGKSMDTYTDKSEREKLRYDFSDQLERTNESSNELLETVLSLSSKLSKKDRGLIESAVKAVSNNIGANTSYIREQFDESVDKTVKEAKGELEAYLLHKSLSNLVELNIDEKLLGEDNETKKT